MHRQFRWISAAIFLGLLGLTGCGPALFTDVSAKPQIEGGLAGNWLIAGALPSAQNYSIAVTLDEFGKQISGSPSVSFYCTGAGGLSGVNTGVNPATIGPGGEFTLESSTTTVGVPPVPYYGMTLQAASSTDSPASWQGAFSFEQVDSGCSLPQTGNFVATRIADFTGTYDGTITISSASSSQVIQPTLQIAVQQGGVEPGTTQYSELVLNGSIAVQGSPCVSSGAMTASNPSEYSGEFAQMVFAMNDGSTWSLSGSVEDLQISKLSLYSANISGGSCIYTNVGPNAELIKQ
jgi:hypothetical protein